MEGKGGSLFVPHLHVAEVIGPWRVVSRMKPKVMSR